MAQSNLLDVEEELGGYLDPEEVAGRHSARNPCLEVVSTKVVEYLLEADMKVVEELEQLFGRTEELGLLMLEDLIGPMLVETSTSMDEPGDLTDSRQVLYLTKYFLVGCF
jgi:hypothetical protein